MYLLEVAFVLTFLTSNFFLLLPSPSAVVGLVAFETALGLESASAISTSAMMDSCQVSMRNDKLRYWYVKREMVRNSEW